MAPMKLGYWGLRGLAHPIRFLLEYTGTEYEERRYASGAAPDFDRSEWLNEKFELGLDFPNVPYLIDGDVKLTQSSAILKYIASKHNLMGKGVETYRMDMLEGSATDLVFKIAFLCYDPEFEKKKDAFFKDIPTLLKPYSEYLGTKDWFAGELTYVDFMFYEYLWRFKELKPDSLDEFPNLNKFLERFENLEPIKKYMKSDRYLSRPINAPMAMHGGT